MSLQLCFHALLRLLDLPQRPRRRAPHRVVEHARYSRQRERGVAVDPIVRVQEVGRRREGAARYAFEELQREGWWSGVLGRREVMRV